MVRMKNIGNFETVPQLVSDIIAGDTAALERHLQAGWDIEESIKLSKHTLLTPLDIALIMESFAAVKWLVAHGVNLNVKGNPAFLTAVRYCDEDIILYVVEHGADVNRVKTDAYEQALYGNKHEKLPLIQKLGHPVSQYGGAAFREAVGKSDYEAAGFFLQNGVDINYNKPDMVYPYSPTPLCVAAREANLKMCRYLVKHGADVTIAEKDGMRPYSIALENGDGEMAEFFKKLEPHAFHNLSNKKMELKKYRMPKRLCEFLQGADLTLAFEKCYGITYIKFLSFTDVVPFKVGRQRLLRLSKVIDNYSDLALVWHPATKQIACYDAEHKELTDIAPFDAFMADAAGWMQKIVDGEI